MKNREKEFLYLVDDGWRYERRELLLHLKKTLSFDVATHDEKTAGELKGDFRVHRLKIYPLRGNPLYTALLFFARELDTESIRRVRVRRYHESSAAIKALMLLREALGKLGLRRYSYSRALKFLYRNSNRYGDLLEGYKFLIFSPFTVVDKRIIYEAQKKGIRIICSVFSWDNPWKDNEFMPDADRYLVWNKESRANLQKLHGIPPEIVDIVGPTQFDYLLDRRPSSRRKEKSRYVLFTCSTGTPYYIVQELELVLLTRRLLDEIEPETGILVRPYPFSNDEHAYDSLEGERGIEVASYGTFRDLKVEMTRDDLDDRLAQIEGAACVVNVGSTIGLETSYTDTPIIQIAFTLPGDRKPWQDLSRVFGKDHLSWIIDDEYPNTVHDPAQLKQVLADVLRGRTGPYVPYRKKLQSFARPLEVGSFKDVFRKRLEELLEELRP
jgi:hypothetical protein